MCMYYIVYIYIHTCICAHTYVCVYIYIYTCAMFKDCMCIDRPGFRSASFPKAALCFLGNSARRKFGFVFHTVCGFFPEMLLFRKT